MSEGLYSMEAKDYDKTLDLTKIKPYGDTMNDGKTQLSFTLPVPAILGRWGQWGRERGTLGPPWR